LRCFVAAWPDEATRERLRHLQSRLVPQLADARKMQPRNLHLTLAFIGAIAPHEAGRVAACDAFTLPAFDWQIGCLGWFARARVLWVGGDASSALASAAARVRAALDDLGVSYDRKPFVPHVTLFRDVRDFTGSGPLETALAWRTAHVALYAADRDARGPLYRRVPPEGA
jgi:2'-5' RNA ligase